MEEKIVLGRLCRDRVTLAEGVCIGFLDWMFGCRSYLAKCRTGKKHKLRKLMEREFHIPEACIEVVDPTQLVEINDIPMEEPRFFGKMCRDKVTGYEGICIGRLWVFYSEKQYCLQGKYNKKKNTKEPSIWVDEGRIEVIEDKEGIQPREVQTERKGGVTDIPIPAF